MCWRREQGRLSLSFAPRAGLDHPGVQVETTDELQDVRHRLQRAERPVLEEGATTCCYAAFEKSWITDPQGLAWGTFLTHGAAIA